MPLDDYATDTSLDAAAVYAAFFRRYFQIAAIITFISLFSRHAR